MASLGSFAADLIERLGGKPSPGAEKLFNSWQRWEGGHTANSATWNPLNLTAPGSGLPTINSVGVVALPSEQAGVMRTAKLLQSGYPSIAKALATGKVNFQDPGLQADFNRWLTGKRTPGMSQYVSKIASSFGAPVPAGAGQVGAAPPAPPPPSPPRVTPGGVPLAPGAPPPVPAPPQFDPGAYRKSLNNAFLTGGGRIDLSQMPSMFESSFKAVAQAKQPSPYTALPTTSVQNAGIVDPGGDLAHPKQGNAVTKIAATQIGKPYVFGSGPSTSSFDCSDLIQWSYRQLGITLPRTTYDQIKVGKAVDASNPAALRPGDLVFPTGHHVVMYVGDGKVIAAPHTGTVVQYQPLSQFGKLLAVRRVL